MITPELGARLKEWRESAGLSRQQLAERSRVSASYITAVERGEDRRP